MILFTVSLTLPVTLANVSPLCRQSYGQREEVKGYGDLLRGHPDITHSDGGDTVLV